MQYLIVLAVLAVTFSLITGPLRTARRSRVSGDEDVAGLEAARELKLQEIRDAELDLRTGKLSDDDHQAIDLTLRTEAVEIMRRLDDALGRDGVDPVVGEGPRGAGPSLPSPP